MRYWTRSRHQALVIAISTYVLGWLGICAALKMSLLAGLIVYIVMFSVAQLSLEVLDKGVVDDTYRELKRFIRRSLMLWLALAPVLPIVVEVVQGTNLENRPVKVILAALNVALCIAYHAKEYELKWWKQRTSSMFSPSTTPADNLDPKKIGNVPFSPSAQGATAQNVLERLQRGEAVRFGVHHRYISNNLAGLPFFAAAAGSALYLTVHGIGVKDWALLFGIGTILDILALIYQHRKAVVLSPGQIEVVGPFRSRKLQWKDIDQIVVAWIPSGTTDMADKIGIQHVYLRSNVDPSRSLEFCYYISNLGPLVDVISIRTGLKPRYQGRRVDRKVGELPTITAARCSICGRQIAAGKPVAVTASGKVLCRHCASGLEKLRKWHNWLWLGASLGICGTVMGCFGPIFGPGAQYEINLTRLAIGLLIFGLALWSLRAQVRYFFWLPLGVGGILVLLPVLTDYVVGVEVGWGYSAIVFGLLLWGAAAFGLEVLNRAMRMADAYLERADSVPSPPSST